VVKTEASNRINRGECIVGSPLRNGDFSSRRFPSCGPRCPNYNKLTIPLGQIRARLFSAGRGLHERLELQDLSDGAISNLIETCGSLGKPAHATPNSLRKAKRQAGMPVDWRIVVGTTYFVVAAAFTRAERRDL
jgi:hypothetical protein